VDRTPEGRIRALRDKISLCVASTFFDHGLAIPRNSKSKKSAAGKIRGCYCEYVCKHVYGDKDTFHLSWRFCGHDVCVPTQVPGWHVCAFIQMGFAGN
jgi:hypothetical protein